MDRNTHRLQTRKYTDKDGVEKYATEIVAENMQMLGSRQAGDDQGAGTDGVAERPARPPASGAQPASAPTSSFSEMDDDIPF